MNKHYQVGKFFDALIQGDPIAWAFAVFVGVLAFYFYRTKLRKKTENKESGS